MALAPYLKGSRIVVRLFALAIAIAVGVQLYRFDPMVDPYEADESPFPPELAGPVAPPDTRSARLKVHPGFFRPQIVQLEQALYKLEAKRDDGWAVEVRAGKLKEALLQFRDDPGRIRAGIAVSRFESTVGTAMDGYRGPDWPAWRKQWETIRREHFGPADFFARYDPMGVPIAPPRGEVSRPDRAAVAQISHLIPEVQVAARRAMTRALQIQEPLAAFGNTADGQHREGEWRTWAAAWNRELDSLERGSNPGLSANADPYLVRAVAELDSAFSRFRPIRSASGQLVFPTKHARRQRFDSALVRLHEARDLLSRVGSP